LPELQDHITAVLQHRYAIQREIGHGGMAVVYLARDLKHDRDVALKVLQPHLAEILGRERFLLEVRVAAPLHLPHLLPLYDSGDADGSLYYVLPYVEGGSLRDRLSRETRLEFRVALQLMREVAEALDYAHKRKVVHRDIKPENILLDQGHAVVADFGVARAISEAVDTQITQPGLLVGTPDYMSPEQTGEEPVDGRSDIYGLACVLFELLSGVTPFAGQTPLGVLARRLVEPAPRLSDRGISAPARLEQVLARALARRPEDRFATAGEFAQQLAEVANEATQPRGTPAGGTSSSSPWGGLCELYSVAVLPFVNLSPDRENEYFSDGMAEEIINALTQVKGLRVAARTSCFALKGKDLDAQTIAQRLRVNSLVEGSIRKSGNRIRLTAQLVDAADGYQRWSQTYERTMSDVFTLQEELAHAIVGELPLPGIGSVQPRLVRPVTENLEAYTLYMRGRYFANRRTTENLRLATDYFDQAVALDPSSAPVHSGLAACWSLLGFEEFGELAPQDAMPKAKAAALRAIELDPSDTDAQLWLGVISMLYDWEWAEAEAHLRMATESGLNPIAHLWYAVFLAIMSRYDESLARIRRAQTVDPISLPVSHTLARCYAWAGEYEKAIEQLRATQQMEPHHHLTYVWLGRTLLGMGRFQDALTELQTGIDIAGRLPLLLQVTGCAYGRLGMHSEAREILEELRQLSTARYVSPIFEAYVLAAMGELDEAFQLFGSAMEQRSGLLAFLRVTQETASPALISDPRFTTLLQKLHLDF
jgi:serine/threonine protein kinase/Flp pilus assembly protein TadD